MSITPPMPATEPPPAQEALPTPAALSPLAGVLSYLVPGLGQISQGRVGKGLLFLVCIYALFFYGMWLGSSTVTLNNRTYKVVGSVYLPHASEGLPGEGPFDALRQNLFARPQFVGQFFVGVVSWPAVVQYLSYDPAGVRKIDGDLDTLYAELDIILADKKAAETNDQPDLAATKTADAERKRKEIAEAEVAAKNNPAYNHPRFGDLMREPRDATINVVANAGDKRQELSWVYTVIAGVLNIMVIYDAVAGPAFLSVGAGKKEGEA